MNKKITYVILIFIVVGLVVLDISSTFNKKTNVSATNAAIPPQDYVTVGSTTFKVVTADNDAARTQGLSGTESMPKDFGMLFIFDMPGTYGFWMKDMLYPLDIVWIDASSTIIYAKENLSPQTYPTNYAPTSPAKYVLEINAGIFEKTGAKIGDTVSIFKK